MIELVNVSKTYRMGDVQVHALRGVSLRIDQGEFVAIVGPSGSGKSTLMHILGLLDAPDSGEYRLNGREVRGLTEDERATLRARSIGFVFQQFNLLPRLSARDNVALPLIYDRRPAAVTPEALLERVGLGDRKRHAPNELSGGQQQRVAIARALVNSPGIVMADEPSGNLDSASSHEIMDLLRELHTSGLTVILVTHDPEVARTAHRTITIRDGQVVEDTGPVAWPAAVEPPAAARPPPAAAPSRSWALQRAGQEVLAMLAQAGRSLAANKVRTALSMLGVLIGVAAVIAVMALGSGAKQAVEERISSMGANLLVLMPQRQQSRGVALGAGAVSRLTLEDATAVASGVPGVQRTSPNVRASAQLTAGGGNWRTQVLGIGPDYAAIHASTPAVGRFVSADDVLKRARVAVIGLTVSRELFGSENPVGRTIRINRVGFEVVGLLPDKGSSPFMDENDQVLVPVTTAMRRLFGREYVDSVEIQVADAANLEYVELAAAEFMKKRHRSAAREEEPFQVRNMADIQSTMAATSQTLSVLLLGIGGISLFVGGIGIMNIMLVSVTERTREIGVRKAVGARRRDILLQFLVESVTVSACGGLLGLALGSGASLVMARVAGWRVVVSSQTVLVALGFSALVGIVFGLWPARKASALQPIQALRYE